MFLKPVDIAILDDNVLFRKVLINYLSNYKDIKIIFQWDDFFESHNDLLLYQPEIIIINNLKPTFDTVSMLRDFHKKYTGVRILLTSVDFGMAQVRDFLKIGIYGCLSKEDEPFELIKAIQSLTQGKIYRNNLLTEALYLNQYLNIDEKPDQTAQNLSEREKTVLQMIWDESDNKSIAAKLFLSVRSVEKIRQDVKERLGVKTTLGLIKYAMKERIIIPEQQSRPKRP